MDIIEIIGLQVPTRIGVHNWEQQILQPLIIDIKLMSDFSHCQDDLNHTIDYDALSQKVIALVENNSFKLIETVANQIAHFIKTHFTVAAVEVTVAKPTALGKATNVKVTVQR